MVFLVPVVLFLSNLLNYVDRQLFSALFPVLTSVYRLSDVQVGLLGSAFTFSYLLAAPLAGILSDRLNSRWILGMGILLFSLGMLICASSLHVQGLFAGRMLTGAGEAALLVVGPQIFGIQDRPGLRIGFFLSAMPIGGAIGFALAMRSPQVPVSQVLMIPVFPGLLLGGLLFFIPYALPFKGAGAYGIRSSAGLLLRNRNLLSLIGVQICNAFVLGGMAVWISLYLTREKHLSPPVGSMLTGVSLVVGGFLGMILLGILCDRTRTDDSRGVFQLIQAGQFLSFAGIMVVLFGKSEPVLLMGLLLSSVGLFGINVPLLVAFMRLCDAQVWGMLLGTSLLLTHLFGDLPSSYFIGLLSSHMGLSNALLLLLPLAETLGVVILWKTLRVPCSSRFME